MKYIVMEIQTDSEERVANVVTQHDTLAAAESAYYAILSAAAISQVPVHSAVLLTNEGISLLFNSFTHGGEA